MQGQRYTNGVLTAIAALLGLNFVGQVMDRGADVGAGVSTARAAQPEQYRREGATERPMGPMDPTEGGMVSAAEQRKVMIAELRNLGARLASIETKLGSGVSVSVTEMPAMNWPAQASAGSGVPVAGPASAAAEPAASPSGVP